MRVTRFAPLSGVIAVVLIVIAFIVGGATPDIDASGAKIASFYDSHQGRQHVAAFLIIWATPFLVMFGASLFAALREREGGSGAWSRVAFSGILIAALGLLITAGTTIALIDGADKSISGQALQALNGLNNDSWVVFVPGLGIMFLGSCVPLMRERTWLRWLGWLALILGVVSFVPFISFFGFLGSSLWILLVATGLFTASRTTVPEASRV